MAGEAVSRTSLTLAFQKRKDLEWRKLRQNLHQQLQQDISRIYTNSLYCDLELELNTTTIQAHRSVLQTRATQFFNHLCKLSAIHNGLQSITFSSSSVECITKFIRNIYTKCSIHDDEIAAIRCLDKSTKIGRLNSIDSVLSPESEIYLTPNCSPSDIFPKTKVRSGDGHLFFQDETQDTINIHQTNRSYYSIVPVDEVFNVAESSLKVSESDILEKELAEQDELLKSFHSIKSKEEKKTAVNKIKKPTSLPFSSSHYTKKQKHGCDINEIERLNKQLKYNSDLFPCPFALGVEANEQIKTTLKKENITNGIEYGCNSIKEKEFLKIHKYTKLSSSINTTCNEINQNKIDEDFMCSPIEIGECVLECCSKNSEDVLNFPCSPEMDASGAGPDSGVDTSSTGCIPGGGLSSPREHTVSETSGVDLTDDIPHDGEEKSNFLAKLSASSSVSSEVGTWDNSFHPINTNTEQIDVSAEETVECSSVGIITQNKKSSVDSSDNLSVHETVLVTSLPNIQSEHTNTLSECYSNEDHHNVGCIGEPDESENQNSFDITFDENESLTSGFYNTEESMKSDCFDVINISNEWAENKSNVKLPEPNFITYSTQPVTEGHCSEWKIESTPLSSLGSSNFFIDASSLVDDSELLLPPFQATASQSKIAIENSTSEYESSKFGDEVPATPHSSPCHENINTEATSKQSISSSSEESSQTNSNEEKSLNIDISHDTGTSPELELNSKRDNPIVVHDSHLEDIPQNVSDFIEIEESLHTDDLVNLDKKKYSQPSTPTHFKRDYKKSDCQDVRAEFQKEIVVKTSDSEVKACADDKMTSNSVKHHSRTNKELLPIDVFESRIECCPVVLNETCKSPNNIIDIDQHISDVQVHTADVTNSFINCYDLPTNDSEKNEFVEVNEKSEDPHTISVNNNNDELKSSAEKSNNLNSELEVSEEQRRPSLIRRNTFELDPDDDKLALLRQEYERRQGNLLFKTHIPQFSGHVTGSEGFRDTQSLIVVGTVADTDVILGHSGQTSLPNINMYDSFVLESSSMVSNMNQLLNSQIVKDVNSSYASNSYLKSDEKQNISKEQNVIESFSVDQDTNDLNESNESAESSKKIPLLFDNNAKPVVSGAITFSDLLDDKKSWESPKKPKRTESTPIVSGGVSYTDFSSSLRKVNDSPIMTRRKNESAPILSGAAPYLPEANAEIIENRPVSNATTKSAWIVDMSVSSRPPLDVKKRRKSDVLASEPLEMCHKKNEVKVSGHGFFIPIEGATDKETLPYSEKSQLQMENKIQKSASASSVKTTGLGYFVDFDEPRSTKEKSEKQLASNSSEINILPSKPKVEDLKLSCGFFVDLKNEGEKGQKSSVNLVRQHSADEAKTSSTDKKNAMFSMFIDIGSAKQELPPKLSTPQVSRRRLIQKVQEEKSVSKVDITQISKTTTSESSDSKQSNANVTYMYIDASGPPSSEKLPPVKQCEVVNDNSEKKQAVFMFIETDSPVIRRKTLPSGLRPNFNRHSWNPDNRTSQVTEEQQVLLKRQHKRAHSLSVDRSSISTVNKNSKLENESVIIKSGEPEENHLQSKNSTSQSSEILTMQHMAQSYNSTLPVNTSDKFEKHAISLENKVEAVTDFIPDLNIDKHASIHHNQKYDGVACDNIGSKTSSALNEIKILGMDQGQQYIGVRKTNNNKESEVIRSDSKMNPKKSLQNGVKCAGDCIDKKQSKFSIENAKEIQRKNRLLENNDASSSIETTIVETKAKLNSSSGNESFVKLSDLDKEPEKSLTQSVGSNDALPSFATTNRMTRSIPETSWIENKLLMTRSIGSGTSSKSLSRLFPHLHTVTSTSPSSLVHSKSTSSGQLEGDEENQVSETSDLSSMQSSMGPSGLEGSTEETDASSSYAGRSGPVSRLGEDLLRMFLEEINPDVTVEVGGRRLKAHKCILASRCQYFAAILSGGWVESAGNVISLQGFSYNAVHFALCHIYSGTSNIPDTISIVELATLADMLGLEGLKEVIMYTLKVKYCHFFHKPCSMCAVGVLECLPLAAAYGLDEIYRKSLRWITKHFVRIWPTKSFASLPRELVEKCYQQHVVHMTTENVLETIMSCDKLLATLPNVRWAEPIFSLTSQLLDASIKYMSHNFSGVLASDNFQSLGKELSWNISRLEDSLFTATDRLPPDQACLSYTYLNKAPDPQWSPNFIELLVRLQKRVELNLVRQAPRAARTASWNHMPLELRQRIQEAACLVLVPSDEAHRFPHAALSRRSTSSSGSRNLDLRQVKLAMTQQARRAASGGRVSVLRADNSRVRQKPQAPNPEDIRKTPEAKSKTFKHKANHSTSNVPTPEKATVAPRRTPKTMISSSDSSRTSSPAMRRSAAIGENTAKNRMPTTSNKGTTGTPPLGREVRSRKKKDGETAMSTDSLAECLPAHNNSKRPARETTDHVTSRSISSTRPDTPHVRRKGVDDGIMSTDSLSESATSTGLSFSAPNATRPETPKQRRHNILGRLGTDVTMSTDSLVPVDHSQSETNRLENSKYTPGKVLKTSNSKNESQQSPSSSKKSGNRQSIASPRDSPTARLRSGLSPYTGSPSLRRNVLMSAKPSTDNAANNNVKQVTTTTRAEKGLIKTNSSPSTSFPASRRTPTRVVTRGQVVSSPAKVHLESNKTTGNKNVGKSLVNTNKINNNAVKKISNGVSTSFRTVHSAVRHEQKKEESMDSKLLTVGSRSGTFLKDEPTVLKKPEVEDVCE